MTVTCPNCGAKNRIDEQSARTRQPICGRCKHRLDVKASSEPIVINDANFQEQVLGASLPVLLDCWAPWCGPCRMLAPTIDALAAEAGGQYIVGKLNTDENPDIAGRFQINSIPTLLIFKQGKLVEQLVGLRKKEELAGKLRQFSHSD